MATLGNIRKRSGLLIIAIGVALLAFLLSDLIRKGSLFKQDRDTVGVINGQKIGFRDFSQRVNRNTNLLKGRDSNSTLMDAVNQTWKQVKRQVIIAQQMKKLGLAISENQEWDALVSNPYIRQNRQLYTNGKFDQAKFAAWLAQTRQQRPAVYNRVLAFNQQIKDQTSIMSYYSLINDGIYTSTKEAAIRYGFENAAIDVRYVMIPFKAIEGTSRVTDAEIQAYAKAHKKLFERPASRAISYVLFDVKPSEADRQAVLSKLKAMLHQTVAYNAITKTNDTIASFEDTQDVKDFVNAQSDVNYDSNYKALDRFSSPLQGFLKTARQGAVFGPYKVKDTYRLSKLIDETRLPDSVKVRHILITYAGLRNAPKGVKRSKPQAKKLADSLYTAIQHGADFARLAKTFGEDASKKRSGDLGWAGYDQFVPAFRDYAFTHKKGSTAVVETRFGFHIINIVDQKAFHPAYKVATIVRQVAAGERAERLRYAQAAKFFEDTKGDPAKLERRAEKEGLKVRLASGLKDLDSHIAGLESARGVIKWLYAEDTRVGDSRMFNQGSGSAVVFVTAESPEGLAPLAELRSQIKPLLEKKKQLEVVKQKLSGKPSLKGVAKRYNTSVRESNAVHFANPILTGAGREPRVIGTAFGMRVNTVSEPLLGENGIFLVKVLKKTPAAPSKDYTGLQKTMTAKARQNTYQHVYKALEGRADIQNHMLKVGY